MSGDILGYVFTIAGSPYAWGTKGTSAVSTGDARWWSATVLDGFLEWPDFQWTEKAKPLDGDLDVSGFAVKILDGDYAGERHGTAFFTRDPQTQVSSPITATVTSGATTIAVANGSLFTSPSDAWIGRECVRITSISTNTLTVTRARYGTRSVEHTLDQRSNRRPEVFASPPWAGVARHCYLWMVVIDDTGFRMECLFQGVTGRPALRDERIEIPVEHLWSHLRVQRIGETWGVTEAVGVGGPSILGVLGSITVSDESGSIVTSQLLDPPYAWRSGVRFLSSLASLASRYLSGVTGSTSIFGGALDPSNGTSHVEIGWTAGDEARSGVLKLMWEGDEARVASVVNDASTRLLRWSVEVPSCAYTFMSGLGGTQTVYVRSTLSLPTTWEGSTTTTEGRETRASRVLRASAGDWWVVLTQITVDNADASLTCKPAFVRKEAKVAPLQEFLGASQLTVTDPALTTVLQITADHWADGWRYGVIPELSRDTWDDHWDWTTISTLARIGAGVFSRRVQYFDSSEQVGALLTQDCLLGAASPVVRSDGKLALWAWELPRGSETSAATYSTSTISSEVTEWSPWAEGLTNAVTFKAQGVSVRVTDSGSIERYGSGREINLELKGVDGDRIRSLDPVALKSLLLSRLTLWSQPVHVVTLAVPLLASAHVGDLVTVTEWMAPNGLGSRGLTEQRVRVVSRTVDLATATAKLDCLIFGRTAYGYSAVARVASSPSTTEVTLEAGAFDGSVGFDGVASSTCAGDFGNNYFCELIQRDTDTPLNEVLEVDSVGATTIKFKTAINASIRTAIGVGAWYSVRFASYATSLAAQQALYAWIADATTLVIDGTTTEAQRIAP